MTHARPTNEPCAIPLTTSQPTHALWTAALASYTRADLCEAFDRTNAELGRWLSDEGAHSWRPTPPTVRRLLRVLLAWPGALEVLTAPDNGCIDPLAYLLSQGLSRDDIAECLGRRPEDVSRWASVERPKTIARALAAMARSRQMRRELAMIAREEAADRPDWVAVPDGRRVRVDAAGRVVVVAAPSVKVGTAEWIRWVRGAVVEAAISGTLAEIAEARVA